MTVYGRNLLITLVCVVAAVICAFLEQKEVALAFVAFVGGLWMKSGREPGSALVVLLLLCACQPAPEGFTAEIGARIGRPQPSAQGLTMSPLAGGISVGRVELKPDAAPTITSGYAGIYALNTDNLLYTVDAGGTTLKLHAAQSFRTSANCSGLSSPANGDVCYDTTIPGFRYYVGGWTTASIDDSLLVHKAGSETITGAKTFTAATLFNGAVTLGDAAADVITNKGTLRIENTANTFYVTLTHAASANRAVTLPDAAGAVVLDSATQTLTNKTLTTPTITSAVLAGTTTGTGLVAKANGGTNEDNSTGGTAATFWARPTAATGAAAYRVLASGDIPIGAASNSFLAHADSAAATQYLGGADATAASASQRTLFVAHSSQTILGFVCTAGTAPGGAVTDALTVIKSSDQGATWSDTTSTVNITGAAKTAVDVTNHPTVVRYDWLGVKIVRDAASVGASYSCQVVLQ